MAAEKITTVTIMDTASLLRSLLALEEEEEEPEELVLEPKPTGVGEEVTNGAPVATYVGEEVMNGYIVGSAEGKGVGGGGKEGAAAVVLQVYER